MSSGFAKGRIPGIVGLTMIFTPPGFVVFAAVLAAVGSVAPAADLADDPDGRKLVQEAHRAIATYHRGQPKSGATLRVVYFHPSDRDPLPNYAERLDRVMTDVSDFYRDGLRRFGVETNGLPLERKDGRLVLQVVRGKSPANAYTYESGGQPRAEIAEALQGRVDLKREHVLVLYGLCRREDDGRYVFDAPYYGGGDAKRGLCHAADCELLDPLQLTETQKKIVYTEHYYPRQEQTVARFNSWYLGGLAHELGHGLGLDHDAGEPAEQGFGTSLMGSGNHTYRQEVWGGGRPTFLSRASALLLAAHPLFTGSDRGRRDEVGIGFAALTFFAAGKALGIRGVVERDIEPHAVVAQVWPARVKEENKHAARTFSTVVRGDGRELYRSRVLRVGASAAVKVSVAGMRQLELIAEGGEGHVHNSWAIWAEPELRR